MREKILISSAIKSIDSTCAPCPKSNSREACAFGYSAVKTFELRTSPETIATAIVYVWDKQDPAQDCSKAEQVQVGIKDLRKAIK